MSYTRAVDNPDSIPAAPPARSRAERRAQATADALRTLVRDLFADRHGAIPPQSDVELTLRARVKPGENWALAFDPPLVEQLADQMADAQAARAAFVKGAVFCYRCERSDCEHARPDSPRAVFAGYDAAGRPTWEELAQALVRLKHPRVDELYAKPPAILAAMQYGRDLRGEQLAAFGRASKTYAVLGQVVAGYFAAPPRADAPQDAAERLAVSFQFVETRGARGEFRLHLNALAGMPDGGAFELWLGTGAHPALARARDRALREVEALSFSVAAARERGDAEGARNALRGVPGILHRLVDAVERGERQRQRRTRHVEQRREESRPVHKALEDAQAAKDDAFFFDVKAETIVVAGPKGRTHAFTAEGRHVTSFVLRPGAADFRVRTGRWRPADPEERAVLRAPRAG